MKSVWLLILLFAVSLVLTVPAMAQGPCSVLQATDSCPGGYKLLQWTSMTEAAGYKVCFVGNKNCYDAGTSLFVGFKDSSGTYDFNVIPYDSSGNNLCESNHVTATFPITCNIPAPEFPSTFLPVTMIIGFLGAVLYIQRTKEH